MYTKDFKKIEKITKNNMTPEEMLAYTRRNPSVTMWAMVNNVWKEVVEVVGDWITIKDHIVPSEIGKTRCIPVRQCTEFDLTVTGILDSVQL